MGEGGGEGVVGGWVGGVGVSSFQPRLARAPFRGNLAFCLVLCERVFVLYYVVWFDRDSQSHPIADSP